ncbi:pyruvate/phosphoenolpyruvate kinase [Tanacetum coccineum]
MEVSNRQLKVYQRSSPHSSHTIPTSSSTSRYWLKEYDEEIEAEPRQTRANETTPALRIGSPSTRRSGGRVVGFEGVRDRDTSISERESGERVRVEQNRTENGESRGNTHLYPPSYVNPYVPPSNSLSSNPLLNYQQPPMGGHPAFGGYLPYESFPSYTPSAPMNSYNQHSAGPMYASTMLLISFGISAARLGLPDTGLISYGEMLDQGRLITEAVSIPVIGDGDNGYGNAMNTKRTVKGFIKAGFAGILLEDQVSPKACGHTQGRKVVSREEAVMKIKAAVDARKESGSDIVIVARTDSRQALSVEEALWRSRAFAEAGADVLFVDALASKEEMKAFCEVATSVPKLANMLEGGGKTPILTPLELEDIGYKIVAYPLSLMGVSIRAMEDALVAIKGGRVPPPGSMASFDEVKEVLGFNTYYEEEKRYATKSNQFVWQTGSSNPYSIQRSGQDDTEQKGQGPTESIVELLSPDKYGAGDGNNPFSGIWSRTLRVKIIGRDGFEKLDVRIPAGFLDGITNIVPGGVNIKALLDDASFEVGGKLLLDFNDSMGDRIQVFLECSTVRTVVNVNETIQFMMDSQGITYTVDMFRATLKLQVETPTHPFIAPPTLQFIQPFLNIVGYQGDVDKILYAVISRVHVDYAGGIFFTEYKEYAKVFVGVDVPTIQPQQVKSTQGANRTPRATRIPNPADVVPKKRKGKQVARETSSPIPSLNIRVKQQKPISTTSIPPSSDDRQRDEIHETTLLSLTMHKTAIADEEQENIAKVQEKILEEDVEKMVEGEDEESYASEFAGSIFLNDEEDSGTRIEPESHKLEVCNEKGCTDAQPLEHTTTPGGEEMISRRTRLLCSKKLIYLSISFMTKFSFITDNPAAPLFISPIVSMFLQLLRVVSFSAPAVPLTKECSPPFSSIYRLEALVTCFNHNEWIRPSQRSGQGTESNVVGYATGAAAHKEFSKCLACYKKTCDNTQQLAHECPGKHHSRPGSGHWFYS